MPHKLDNLYRYKGMLRRLATKKMELCGVQSRAKATSEDVVHSTLAEALKLDIKFPAPDDDLGPIEEYVKSILLQILFLILDRKVYKHFRKKDCVLPAYGVVDENQNDLIKNATADSEDLLFDEAIEDLLSSLPVDLRQVAELAVVCSSVDEISEALNVSDSTTYRRLERIKKHALDYHTENL